MSRNEYKFWLLLLILNTILFLPGYLFNMDTSHFFPVQGFIHGSIYERCKTIFVRSDLDIFRISVDLFLIVFFYYIFRKLIKPGVYGWLAGIYYIVILMFLIYFNAFEKLYHIPPIIYNDLSLLKLGFFNIGDQSIVKSMLYLSLVITVFIGLIWAVRRLIEYTRVFEAGTYSKSIMVLLGLLLTINTLKSGFTYTPNQIFQETFASLAGNIKSSVDANKNLKNFKVDKVNRELNYNDFNLKARPDIYLLFMESYGRILYENKWLCVPFINCLDSCSEMLSRHGWNMTSGFSISPVSGGESWISYTSVMFGYNIRNQGTFNSMLKDTSMIRYDNLFRVLQKKGYMTFRLNAMPQNSNLDVPWVTYTGFYSISKWINFRDMGYTGRLYGFGPSPPDQYSINFAAEYIKQKYPGPHALFFITQTTHHPFFSPNSIVADWHSLNNDRDSSVFHAPAFLKKPRKENYLKAICYDVSALTQFISNNRDSSAIYIVIGDHQPPVIAGNQDGFETPVHIICRNREFTKAFQQYGFREGLKPDLNAAPIRHEGIYSMFLREFVQLYGNHVYELPEYRPYGLTTN